MRARLTWAAATALVVAALVVPVSLAAPAGADDVRAPAVGARQRTEPDPGGTALARATRALAPRSAPASRGLDATIALRDLFVARPTLGDRDDVRRAGQLLARPTDGRRDPYGEGYTVPSRRRCSAHFCVHWVSTTRDAPPSNAWVRTTLRTMEQVWRHHVDRLGYRRPPGDGTRGGDARFDVYLKELGHQSLYGFCAPERRVPGRSRAASSFCVLDNDFARSQFHAPPIDELRVTAAHEFFHAIQFGYDFHENPWLLEATATWMERRFAPAVDDNRVYLPYGQVGLPGEPLDTFDGSGFNQYGNWAFFAYLSEHYGNAIVRRLWQHLGDGRHALDYSIQGVAAVLRSHGGLRRVYAAYAAGNPVAARSYAEGRGFPSTSIERTRTLTARDARWSYTTRVDHLAAADVRLQPASSLHARTWRLRVRVDAPDAVTSPAAYLVVRRRHGALVRRPIPLTAHGFGSVSLAFSARGVRDATITLANVSTRYRCHRGTTFSCEGTPRDDGQRFVVRTLLRR